MKTKKTSEKCRTVRDWLCKVINRGVGLEAGWVRNHIAHCPRCQRRFAWAGKVNLALSIIKSQPHNIDLLKRANAQAIGVLRHSLRNAPKAQKLKTVLPEPKLLERFGKYKSSIANTAACIVILFLMKAGVFSSMDKFQTEGKKVVKQYYSNQVGEELADEIFHV